jgi:hypothetical protein
MLRPHVGQATSPWQRVRFRLLMCAADDAPERLRRVRVPKARV